MSFGTASVKRWLIVIPARLESTRLARKPLQDLAGKPLIVRVYENLQSLSELGAQIVVATDSTDVLEVCQSHSVNAVMTRDDHPSGTDRCNEVAQKFDCDFVLNVQGDEPFVNTKPLKSLVNLLESTELQIGTIGYLSDDIEEFNNPNLVKIAVTAEMQALYFSRSGIPNSSRIDTKNKSKYWQHIGIYAYRKAVLEKICKLAPSPLEKTESLEQLRALENGISIGVVESEFPSIGIDTIEDLEKARAQFR